MMNSQFLLAAVLSGLFALLLAAPPAHAQRPGGYIDRKVTDKDVVAAANFALGTVKEKKIVGDRILSAASQVVAGTNYKLVLRVKDLSGDKPVVRKADVVVYHKLSDEYELTSWKWRE